MPDQKKKNVDYKKLVSAAKKRGLSLSEISIGIGRSGSFLAKCKQLGYLTVSTLIGIETVYNIKYEDIKPDVEPEPQPAKTSAQAEQLVIEDMPGTPKLDELIQSVRKLTDVMDAGLRALADATARTGESVEAITKLAKDQEAVYNLLFNPIYSAIVAGDLDRDRDKQKLNGIPRRIDGTLRL